MSSINGTKYEANECTRAQRNVRPRDVIEAQHPWSRRRLGDKVRGEEERQNEGGEEASLPPTGGALFTMCALHHVR